MTKLWKKFIVLLVIILPVFFANQTVVFGQTKPLSPKFQPLRFSEIKPAGWLKKQMEENLAGFVGNLDELVPDLIAKDDIYGKDRLSKKIKSKNVGAISNGGDWEVQFLWWNSETQSNWRDGYIRNAVLVYDEKHLKRIKLYVEKILQTQDKDGYIGIYDKELRYKFDDENGELWSKATLFRGLLAWYEYTQDRKVLIAIQRAVDDVMRNYPIDKSRPFYSKKGGSGGLTHGLAFTDVLDELYLITKDRRYPKYALFLYQNFSDEKSDEDAQLSKLLDLKVPLRGHGAHTYEHLRSVASAYYASGDMNLKTALDNFLVKIRRTTTPSGAVIGDEFIAGREADATETGYEYCSLQELMNSYNDLLSKSGKSEFADDAERVFFNAAQGARHPSESCIAYLKTDNSYEMDGTRNGDTSEKNQTRYKYSSVHQDAAVCCVPNAGRITPYFVQSMWMQDTEGLAATLLGASEVSTKFNGKSITISEETEYPYQNSFKFKVENKSGQKFKLKIRKPNWTTTVESNSKFTEKKGFLEFEITEKSSEIKLKFEADVLVAPFKNQSYVTYGALVFANPISEWEKVSEKYPLAGFPDRFYSAKDFVLYGLPKAADFRVVQNQGLPEIETNLINLTTKTVERKNLVPMGKTILRQVTFEKK